jgi:4'-phosphopantetheinyl transferase EntD
VSEDRLALLFEALPKALRVAYSEQLVTQPSPYSEEETFIARAVDPRQQEFRTGRALARAALGAMGVTRCAIPAGRGRAPQWPVSTVGSISHCRGLCAAVVGLASDYRSVGLDLEVNTPLAPDLVPMIYSPREQSARSSGKTLHPLDLVTFSAKESVFKCLYPLVGDYFDFQDVSLKTDLPNGRFTASLNPQIVAKAGVQQVTGTVRLHAGFLLTFCQVPSR